MLLSHSIEGDKHNEWMLKQKHAQTAMWAREEEATIEFMCFKNDKNKPTRDNVKISLVFGLILLLESNIVTDSQ